MALTIKCDQYLEELKRAFTSSLEMEVPTNAFESPDMLFNKVKFLIDELSKINEALTYVQPSFYEVEVPLLGRVGSKIIFLTW